MAHKQFLHELLKEDQEPFHLKSYIANMRSQFKKTSPTPSLHLKKRNQISNKNINLCNHVCFFSYKNSPDVRKSPFLSPCKSPNGAVFLQIPSKTASLLVEAAMRIQKQQMSSKPKSQSKNAGFGLFGSFLKRLKDRSINKKRAIEINDFNVSGENATIGETVMIPCSCSGDWTDKHEDESFDFAASTSSRASDCSDDDFGFSKTRFCSSPFRFSLHQSPSSSGRRTPEFCSPAASPSRSVKEEKDNCESRNSGKAQGEEEEKEQCSPVSILDAPFEDDGIESRNADEDDYDLDCSYENVQRAKEQLLSRLRRFEKLAELDPIELERKLMEGSDDEDNEEGEVSSDDEALSLYKKRSVETFVTQVFNQHPRNMSTDMKRLVSDLIVEEKSRMISSGTNEVVMGRISNRFDSWKEVEFDTIDMMIGLDLKREFNGWRKYDEQLAEVSSEIELAIYGVLVQELADEVLLGNREMDMVSW